MKGDTVTYAAAVFMIKYMKTYTHLGLENAKDQMIRMEENIRGVSNLCGMRCLLLFISSTLIHP